MILVNCPQCSAQFRVPAHAIPHDGRTLKCSSCAYKWHFINSSSISAPTDPALTPLVISKEHTIVSDAPTFLQNVSIIDDNFAEVLKKESQEKLSATRTSGSNRKSFFVRGPAGVRGYITATLVAVVLIWIGSIGQLAITTFIPRFQSVYDMFGMPLLLGQPDFVFLDVITKHNPTSFTISGKFKNNSSTQKTVPPVRAAIYMADKPDPIALWVFRPTEQYINPGQIIPFELTRDFNDGDIAARLDLRVITDLPPSKTE